MIWETIQETVWERLQRETRPIVLYGMGDGAQKILDVFFQKNISVSGVFASDEFVRGHSFAGFRVERLDEITARLGKDIIIVIAFASQRKEVLGRMFALDAQYDVVAPDVPVAGEGLFDRIYVKSHEEEMRRAYALLADDRSRSTFESMVAFKLTGQLARLKECQTNKDEVFTGILKPSGAEHFVDLGAYNGDTIRELLSYTGGQYASIVAMEPDRKNYKKLQRYVAESLDENIEILNAGAWNEDTILTFAARAGRNSALSAKGVDTAMRSVDLALDGQPCTMMKLDVEGAESRALEGAQKTIRAYAPKLNVAAYHRNEDLFALPLLLHELQKNYRFYLRHHPYVPAWDTNLYAVAE